MVSVTNANYLDEIIRNKLGMGTKTVLGKLYLLKCKQSKIQILYCSIKRGTLSNCCIHWLDHAFENIHGKSIVALIMELHIFTLQ